MEVSQSHAALYHIHLHSDPACYGPVQHDMTELGCEVRKNERHTVIRHHRLTPVFSTQLTNAHNEHRPSPSTTA